MPLVSSMNPPWVIQKYFVQDEGEARPISAHMMATGTVVLATDPVVEQLRQTAISLIGSSPMLTPLKLTLARYAAATKLEDAGYRRAKSGGGKYARVGGGPTDVAVRIPE